MQMFCVRMQCLSGECRGFARKCKCAIFKVPCSMRFMWENANILTRMHVLLENGKFFGKHNAFVREYKCFC